jgi:hypothetical protein
MIDFILQRLTAENQEIFNFGQIDYCRLGSHEKRELVRAM